MLCSFLLSSSSSSFAGVVDIGLDATRPLKNFPLFFFLILVSSLNACCSSRADCLFGVFSIPSSRSNEQKEEEEKQKKEEKASTQFSFFSRC